MKIVSGRCGDEVYWSLNKSSGVLKITGNGSMYHCRAGYDKDLGIINTAPWGIYVNYIRSIDIVEGVTEIGMYAFSDCYNLTDVTIPKSVTKIGSFAFCDCKSLTSVTIGNSVTRIGNYAFSGCSNLTSVTIPDGVTSISYAAFEGCSNLTSVAIPDSITRIGDCAFSGCSNLTSVTIPDSVTSIGYYAFSGCSNLTSVKSYYKAVKIKSGKFVSNYLSNYKYKINEWLEKYDEVIPCKKGYHFCDNLFNIFNYYSGEIDEDIAVFECEVGDIITPYEDKFITNTIKLARRLTKQEIVDVLNKTDIS